MKMNKLWGLLLGIGLVFGLGSGPALAQGAQVYWQCVANPVSWCPVTSSNPLPVTAGGGGGGAITAPLDANGNVKTSTFDAAGNAVPYNSNGQTTMANSAPVALASDQTLGRYNTTLPSLSNGNNSQLQVGARGSLNVQILSANGQTAVAAATASSDDLSGSDAGIIGTDRPFAFDGTNWDRQFMCPFTQFVSVASGTTAIVVGGATSQTVRICAIAVSMSAAGTVRFLTGTGATCSTGSANLSGLMALGTGIPLAIGGGTNSVMRSSVGGNVCVAAATGNVEGWVTYAVY